jgi:hypothetical protein
MQTPKEEKPMTTPNRKEYTPPPLRDEYPSLSELVKAMLSGEVSKKNTIYVDNDCITCPEHYTPDGVEIDFPDFDEVPDEEWFEAQDLYRGENIPRYELIELLKGLGLNAEHV